MAKLEKAHREEAGRFQRSVAGQRASGSARSMPGMMETILNLGLNDKSVEGLAKVTNNERFA